MLKHEEARTVYFSVCFSSGHYKLSVSEWELRAGVRVIGNVSYMAVFLSLR